MSLERASKKRRAARGQAFHGIRVALHPRWTASLACPQCNLYFTMCNPWFTTPVPSAALCVASSTGSAATSPSSRLASGALRRFRCSSGPVHGPPALLRSRCTREIVRGLLTFSCSLAALDPRPGARGPSGPWSNGRTPVFGTGGGGSTPPGPIRRLRAAPSLLHGLWTAAASVAAFGSPLAASSRSAWGWLVGRSPRR